LPGITEEKSAENVPQRRKNSMQISNSDRAKVLVQALPYIQTHAGKTVVVKYGGSAMVDEALKDAVMCDIVLMQLVGIRVVLVHGGGKEIDAMLKKVGKQSRFVGGMRCTDRETIDIVQMVLAGKVNKDLVQLLERHSGRAVGLCGLDDGMLRAEKMAAPEDLGFVGEITEVNPAPLNNATQNGYVPIVAPLAGGEHGEVYNINADVAAARIAAELKAEKLILMTDVRGLLRDKDDENTLIPVVNASEVPKLQKQGIITGGMIPKVDCCVDAVRRGVGRAHIIDGRIPHSILIELFSDEGIGTMFY
jgi:acetylglutamate kinase